MKPDAGWRFRLARSMRPPPGLRAVLPIAVVSLMALPLVAIILLTESRWHWLAFLSGVLLAGLLALATQLSRAQRISLRRSAQLTRLRERLEGETLAREEIERRLADAKSRLALVYRDLPLMMCFLDARRQITAHNEAFAAWVGLPEHRIEGRTLPEVLGRKSFADLADDLDRAYAGEAVREEGLHVLGGRRFQLAKLLVPRFSDQGAVDGVFVILVDVTERRHVVPPRPAVAEESGSGVGPEPGETSPEEIYARSVARELAGWEAPEQTVLAIMREDRFTLFGQKIMPITATARPRVVAEVLVRLSEEEQAMLPPGAFLPILEHFELMGELDRLVLRLLARALRASRPAGMLCTINLSRQSLADGKFPEFVVEQMQAANLPAGSLCFELAVEDAVADPDAAFRFARRVQRRMCHIALTRFTGSVSSLEVLRHAKARYIKIDGTIVRGLGQDPVAVGRVKAICRVARAIDAQLIAEFVETAEALKTLVALGVDFAQGFELGRPQPLATLLRAEQTSARG